MTGTSCTVVTKWLVFTLSEALQPTRTKQVGNIPTKHGDRNYRSYTVAGSSTSGSVPSCQSNDNRAHMRMCTCVPTRAPVHSLWPLIPGIKMPNVLVDFEISFKSDMFTMSNVCNTQVSAQGRSSMLRKPISYHIMFPNSKPIPSIRF